MDPSYSTDRSSIPKELPEKPLLLIAGRLDSHIDRLSFGLVCRSWRSIIHKFFDNLSHRSRGRFPWLLADWNCNDEEDTTTFSISGDGIKKHYTLPDGHEARIVGSIFGWLILLFQDERIEITNLLTRAVIPLPPSTSLEQPHDEYALPRDPFLRWLNYSTQKIVLSSHPQDPYCVAVAITGYGKQLVFTRPGASEWEFMRYPWPQGRYIDLAFYKGKVFALDDEGEVFMCDVEDIGDLRARMASTTTIGALCKWKPARYLVEIKGMLFQVVRHFMQRPGREYDFDYVDHTPMDAFGRPHPEHEDHEDDNRYQTPYDTFGFVVCVLQNREWIRVDNLLGHNLFIGANTSIALEAPSLRRDCIFYLDMGREDIGRDVRHCSGIFDMATGTVMKYALFSSLDPLFYPPLWITPHQ